MDYSVFFNAKSNDKRVGELARLAAARGFKIGGDGDDKTRGVYFVEPRAKLPEDADRYAYIFGYNKMEAKNFVCLSDDETFIKENNYLTALAMKEILREKWGDERVKVLIVGWGKLCNQLERVLSNAEIHVLNFNHHKVQELTTQYGARAYFETVDYSNFPIIINTIPKQVLNADEIKAGTTVYELASAPYGVRGDTAHFKYEVLPGLPGKYFPAKAAEAALDAMVRYIENRDGRKTIVLGITGSSCSYLKLLPTIENLVKRYNIIPVLSAAANLPNRFCDIEVFRKDLAAICGHPIITTIAGAETLAANKKISCSVVLPATGNTIAKLAHAVTDTAVTMAVKALLRNSKPCIMGISTNDALSGSAANIGMLLNRKNYYFVPFSQDDPVNKPFSLACDFARAGDTIEAALQGRQIQPIVFSN